LEDDGATLVTDVRMDRVCLIPGLFYGLEGMRIGGTRRLRIPPPFAFGETGIPDRIPPNAMITAEVSVLAKRSETSTGQAEPQTRSAGWPSGGSRMARPPVRSSRATVCVARRSTNG